MKQYVVTAYDFTDEQAIDRRMAARPKHAEGIITLTKSGNLISAGAILDDNEKMIGSTVHIQFETDQAFKQWLANEVYTTQKVWDNVEVKNVKFFKA